MVMATVQSATSSAAELRKGVRNVICKAPSCPEGFTTCANSDLCLLPAALGSGASAADLWVSVTMFL
jgi:hypothetical protein